MNSYFNLLKNQIVYSISPNNKNIQHNETKLKVNGVETKGICFQRGPKINCQMKVRFLYLLFADNVVYKI